MDLLKMSDIQARTDVDKSGWDSEWRNAHDAFNEVREGDRVLFAERREPLEVRSKEMDNGRVVLKLRGPSGGNVGVREQYNPNGTPDFRSTRGADATNLRIVDRAEDIDDGGDDEDDPTTLPDGRVVGEDVGMNWPSAPDTAEESDGDSFAMNASGDPFLDFDDFYEGTFESGPARKRGLTDRSAGTWTFVDELNALGQDVPKAVNDWMLIDYGVVRDGSTRKAVWLNGETNEAVAVGFVRDPDDDQPTWYCWETDDVESDAKSLDPAMTTQSASEALDYIRQTLYGDVDQVDIEIIEDEDGNITIRDNIDDETLGGRIMDVYGRVPSLPVSISYPTGASGLVGDSFSGVLDYFDDNKKKAGRIGKFVIVYSVVTLSQRFTGVTLTPVIEPKRLGVEVHYKYEGKLGDYLRDSNIGRSTEVGPRDAAGTAKIDGEFTVNPQEFNLHRVGPITPLGLDYESLMQAGRYTGLNNLEMKTPMSDHIDSLRVGTDEEGNVKILTGGSGSNRGKNVSDGRTRKGKKKNTSSVASQIASESSGSSRAVLDDRGTGVASAHKSRLGSSLARNSDYGDKLHVAYVNCIEYIEAWYDENERELNDGRTNSKVGDWWDDVSSTINNNSTIEEDDIDSEVVHEAVSKMINDGKSASRAYRSANNRSSSGGSPSSTPDPKGSTDEDGGADQTDSSGVGDGDIADQAREQAGDLLSSFTSSGNKGELDDALDDMPAPSDLSEEQMTAIMDSLLDRRVDQWSQIEKQWSNTFFPELKQRAAEAAGEEDIAKEAEHIRTYSDDEVESGSPFADAWGADEVDEFADDAADVFGRTGEQNMTEMQDTAFEDRDDDTL